MTVMVVVVAYLTMRLVRRILAFFKHWYVDSFGVARSLFLSLLRRLDRLFALEVTIRHLFQPLFQDRTSLGYMLGFLFRSGRVVAGFAMYLAVATLALLLYLAWLAAPLYVAYRVVGEYAWFPL